MEIIISDNGLLELYTTGTTSDRRYKKIAKDTRFVKALIDAVNRIDAMRHIGELKEYSPFHYEKLKNNQYLSSIRIINGRVERLLFTENPNGIEITLIELNQTHYGNKK